MGTRSIVYIDGFNLYYGVLKDSSYKWLNLEKLFRYLRQDDDIVEIHYFTSRVRGESAKRQESYLQALATLSLVSIHEGRFQKKRQLCRVKTCDHDGSRHYPAYEEKRTDVNIAVTMLLDAFGDRADRFVVVSGDADLVPAVRAIKTRFPLKKVIVYVPNRDPRRGAAVELRGSADAAKNLPQNLLRVCQLPSKIPDGFGGQIEKPTDW